MQTAVSTAKGGHGLRATTTLPLLALAAAAWVATARTASMGMTGAAAFTGAWLVMMAAMMLPAVAPVVGLYVMAARRGVAAAAPFFLGGYALVWATSAVPAYLVSRAVSGPLMNGRPEVARWAGVTLIAAGLYQLTPLKRTCLAKCRSPLGFFLGRRRSLAAPTEALRAGVDHGLYCLGCCWALMAVLIALGGMQLLWAVALSLVITAEKLGPAGTALVRGTAVTAGTLGLALLFAPSLLPHLITM